MSPCPETPCPETPCPEIGCPARGIPAPVLRIGSGRSRRRSGDPVLPVPSCSPGQHHYCRDGDLLRPGPGELRGPGFIRTDVGMPVADHRIDMCRTGPPCNATAGKAGNDTMDSPALHSDLTGALVPAFPVRKTGAAVRFSLRFYAGMARREANGARCEPATGDVRSAQVTGARQEIAGLHTATDTVTDGFLYPGNFPPVFPLFFSLNFRRNPGETGWQHTARTASHTAGFVPCRFAAVLCRVIRMLKTGVFDRDALPGRIHPRIHGKSLQAYFIIRFGYSGWRDRYPHSPGKPPVSPF